MILVFCPRITVSLPLFQFKIAICMSVSEENFTAVCLSDGLSVASRGEREGGEGGVNENVNDIFSRRE